MSKQVNNINPLPALARCLLLAALSLSPLLAGCDKEEHQPSVVEGNVPVSFDATTLPMQPASRAETTGDNLLSMRVFASYTKELDFSATSPINYMYNQEVKRANNTSPWTYSPVKYWPNKQGEKISFFAYSPYITSDIFPSKKNVNGYPYIDYSPGPNATTDIVCASLTNRTSASSSGGVSFEMKHVLARIKVNIANKDKIKGMLLNSFYIGKQGDGRYSFANNSWSLVNEGVTNFSANLVKPSIPLSDDAKNLALADYYFVPTAAMSTVAAPTFTLTYYDPSIGDVKLTNQPLPSTDKWLTGAYLSYNIAIEKQKITVTASSHPTWNDGGTGTVVGTLSIIYAVNPSDPKWGNGGSGSIDGKPVVTHTVQPGEVTWTNGPTEIVDVK